MLTILLVLAFIVLLIGSYADFKYREIPDWLNFAGIFMGLVIRAMYSFNEFDWSYVGHGFFGLIILGIFGTIMFYTGQWGGGDAKMFMALGSLLGFNISITDNYAIYFLINLVIASFIYTIIWLLFLTMKNFEQVKKEYKTISSQKWFLGFKKTCVVLLFIAIVLMFVILTPPQIKFIMFIILAFPTVLLYSYAYVKSVEISSFHRHVVPSELTEGDWIIGEVKMDGEIICSEKDLGISKEQISKLCELYKNGKIKNVLMKTGMPFVPSFFLAFILTLIWQNPLVYF